MNDLLNRYGIKEVADVTFYEITDSGEPGAPVLFLDTLKVSTIEQTAEEATANGGKGNAPLIVWDYGKEITVTLEDALFSPKSLAIMFGDADGINADTTTIKKTFRVEDIIGIDNANEGTNVTELEININGKTVKLTNAKYYSYDAKGEIQEVTQKTLAAIKAAAYGVVDLGAVAQEIEVSANSFPGTYYITGDTYARSETTGKDEFFQFVIPKAKVQSENTITMEADGDPSVFNMSLKVLRPKDGKMMKLIKYSLSDGTATTVED